MKKKIFLTVLIIALIALAVKPYIDTEQFNLNTIKEFFSKEEIPTEPKEEIVQANGEFPDEDYILTAQQNIMSEEQKQEIWANEMRAVWVPYLSLSNVNSAKIDEIIQNAEALGINTIIFHVRPFGDALYKSDIYPWSHLITGTQGTEPSDGLDPLEYAVKACHEKNMKIHAWINPLRVKSSQTNPPNLAENNPANVWINDETSNNVIEYNSALYYNPASEDVRQLIARGAAEIAEKYDVDAIHFDDYFYPATDDTFSDGAEYDSYIQAGGTLSLIEWRQGNIDKLISLVYKSIKEKKPSVEFGISPSGNIENCLKIGANVKRWCSEEGYIDYITPQIYWTFTNPVMPFDTVCESWGEILTNEKVKLYAGLALYKAGSDADDGQWLKTSENIKEQVLHIREKCPKFGGFMLYSYEYLKNTQSEKEIAAFKSV